MEETSRFIQTTDFDKFDDAGEHKIGLQIIDNPVNNNINNFTKNKQIRTVATDTGPDQILPAENVTTTDPAGRVKLLIDTCGPSSMKPLSVPGLLARSAKQFPDTLALSGRNYKQEWESWTFSEYLRDVRITAKAFIKLGLERYHTVCILGFNSPQWFFSDLGAIFAGGIAAGIYTTNSPEACHFCAENSRAQIIVVQDEKQLNKILEIKDRLPLLKTIILIEGVPSRKDVLSWDDVMEIGRKESDDKLDAILGSMGVNECSTLVYTSGTVGHPKGVMLSHDNMTFDAASIVKRLNEVEFGNEILVSYLPLSHVAAQTVDIYLTMTIGASVYFADKDALKGSLVTMLQQVQPTRFLGVPRVYEKIHEKMLAIGASNGAIKQWLGSWAKYHTLEHNLNLMNGTPTNTWSYWLASKVIISKVKAALGLGRCKVFATAAAPMSEDTKSYFMSLDMPIMEAFGMSECSGAHSLSSVNKFSLNCIGFPLEGLETKIDLPDKDGNGEICMRGRHVFMGYIGEQQKTDDAMDSDGYLHSGDVGKFDKKGLLYVTGRIKEILITAGGENIPPVQIEHLVKAELPHISNAMLIGDQKKFLSILITLKTEIDEETGVPLDKLQGSVKVWLKSLGCPDYETLSQVLEAGPDPKVLAAIEQAIAKANKHAVSNAHKVQKFAILPADFSVPTGELGPTLKIKRNVVVTKYEEVINNFYS